MSTVATFNLETETARYYRLPTEGQITQDLREIDKENRRRSDATYPHYRHIPGTTIFLEDGELLITQVSNTTNVQSGEFRYKGFLSRAHRQTRNVEGTIQFLSDHVNLTIRN